MKRKILIASFLKPVDDIRSYEKMAKSLSQIHTYKIYCLGYPSNIEVSDKNIQFLPLRSFKKNGFGRIYARWFVLKNYVKLKPELIIVNSPDLLILTSIYKILFGGKIIYDIHENYFKNLWHQHNYVWGLKHLLALVIRGIELSTAPLFNHFFLAEKVYDTQLHFTRGKSTILENKSLRPNAVVPQPIDFTSPKFIISGTIANEYGIVEGINFYKIIHQQLPNSRLTIIGKCTNVQLYNELEQMDKSMPSLTLKLSRNPIAHNQIETAILSANIGLLPYQPNASILGKWPTKLFEYKGYHLPFFVQKNMGWDTFTSFNQAGVSIDFFNQGATSALEALAAMNTKLSKPKISGAEIFWESEEEKLVSLVNFYLKD